MLSKILSLPRTACARPSLCAARLSSASPASLPGNLKLADAQLLTDAEPRPVRQVAGDHPTVRDMPASVFARAGVLGPTIEVPVVDFASVASTDPNAPPPPPPQTLSLDSRVFGKPLRVDIIHQVVKWQLAKRRQGSANTKRVGEVSGSGRKVKPQKGTGGARAGHSRPPHWKGGAVAHGPKPRDWSYNLNKKVRRLGLMTALSQKLAEGNLVVANSLDLASGKTRLVARTLQALGSQDALVVDQSAFDDDNHSFALASRNLPELHLLPPVGLNVYDMMRREKLILTVAAVEQLQKRLLSHVNRHAWDRQEEQEQEH